MADESVKLILGDTAITAAERSPGRRFFGRRKDRQRPPLTHCENCGAQLTGRYCAQCGQAAVDYRRSFRHVIVDVLDSFLNWDSKFIATIGLLIAKPWRLTNEFLAGKRVRYVHPLRLYLLISIAFFFAASFGERHAAENQQPTKFDETPENAAQRNRSEGAGEKISPATGESADKESESKIFFRSKTDQEPNAFESWIEKRVEEKIGKDGSKGLFFLESLMNNLPGMMLCCVPIFAFVLKILYIFRRIFYIDHLIYALHIHSFAYLATMIIVFTSIGLFRIIPQVAGLVLALLIVAAVIQIFMSIRKVYRQGWIMSLLKFFIGGVVYFVVIGLALAATLLIMLRP